MISGKKVFKEKEPIELKIEKNLNKTRVLVIDDEREVIENINDHLSLYNAEVYGISEPSGILKKLRKIKPQVIIVDYDLSCSKNGVEVVKEIRSDLNFAYTPIIFISGFLQSEYHIEAYNAGADAVLQKPFAPFELLLKIVALLKLNRLTLSSKIKYKDFTIDCENNQLFYKDQKLNLNKRSVEVFRFILDKLPNRKHPVMEFLHSTPWNMAVRSFDVHMCQLRKEIIKATGHDYLTSERKKNTRSILFTYGEDDASAQIEKG